MPEPIVEQVATEVPSGAARTRWLEEGSHIEPDAPPEKKEEAEVKTDAGAPPAEKKAEEPKAEPRVSRSERRIIELLGEVKQLKAQIANTEKPAPAELKEPAKAAEPVEVKPELKDFADVGQYIDALTAFNTKAAIKEYETKRATADAEAAVKRANDSIQTEYLGKVAKAKEKHDDFEAVAFNPDLPIKSGSVVDGWILESENGMEILYHLGQNPAELGRINALKPFAQARELTKLELSLSEIKTAPVVPKKISEAPPPASRVEGAKVATNDESRQAVIDGDVRAFIAAENAKDLARSRRG